MRRALIAFTTLFALLIAFVPTQTAAAMTMVSPVGQPMVVSSPQGHRIHPISGQPSYHAGVDLAADYGDPIYAAASGTVSYSGWMQGYGNTIMIDHGGSLYTLYGHNQELLVGVGEYVTQGMLIAKAGSTGNSTGPHCHFEVLPNGVYGEPTDPGLYVPGLLELEKAQGGGLGLGGVDFHGHTKDWAVTEDFAKPISDLVNKVVELITTGLEALQNYVTKIFFVLVAIDLVLGAMNKAMTPTSEDREGLFKWLVRRGLFYGFCLALLYNWGDFVGNLSLHGFPALGGLAGGNPEAAEAAVSDPTKIVQKGMNIIAPVFNGVLHSSGASDVLSLLLGGAGAVLLMLILAVILFLLFCLIGYYIALAYVEFYMTVLFSFTVFPLAGLKHVRHLASNGINSVFAASINLMFFCLFAAMLQSTMEHIVVGELMSQTVQAQSAGGAPGASSVSISGRPKAELAYRISQIMQERYGKSISPEWIWAQLALESGHFSSALAVEDHNYGGIKAYNGAKIAGISPEGDYYRHFDSDEEYAQFAASNYDAYAPDGIYNAKTVQEFAAALKHGGYFGSSLESYTATLMGILGGSGGVVKQAVANNILLLQLILVVLMYMYFADRISKLVNTQFGSSGFKLSDQQGIFR
ncbi:peptidoglycan DD-metalloendopeptidase family protein [uncultured Selenomonas sp.]|jgi:peptidase M23B|uniref:peptidoglycan DD-metalloendopeptidase family protein n=1 Tax=uncultured Selenomonas sp. TaxID=159275 RepID=UPI0028E80D85|nr:peptidoglycan DD-metalloendopeptidase family protein [uncultured Selenomonas sp.]